MSRRKERRAMRKAAREAKAAAKASAKAAAKASAKAAAKAHASEKRVATGRQIRFGRALGLLVCAAGFAAMGLGWFGTARVSCTDCQIPYLLSGGAVGLGLVIFGVTILVVAQLRAEGRRTADRLERIEARLAEAIAPSKEASAPPAPTTSEQPPAAAGDRSSGPHGPAPPRPPGRNPTG